MIGLICQLHWKPLSLQNYPLSELYSLKLWWIYVSGYFTSFPITDMTITAHVLSMTAGYVFTGVCRFGWRRGGTLDPPPAPPPARTKTGYPYPRACPVLVLAGHNNQPPCPASTKGQDRVPPPHPPPWAGNATDRIWRGRYASCVFTQEDFLALIVIWNKPIKLFKTGPRSF